MPNPARPLVHIRFESEKIVSKRIWFVHPMHMAIALAMITCVVVWVSVKSPAVRDVARYVTAPTPSLYRSMTTGRYVRIEVGDRVYTPDSDPKWKSHLRNVLQGTYDYIDVQ